MKFSEINPFIRNVVILKSAASYKNKLYYDAQAIFVSDGSAAIELGGDVYKIKRGSVAVIKPGEIHSLNINKSSHIIVVHFDYTNRFSTSKSYPLPMIDASDFNPKSIVPSVIFEDTLCLNANVFLDDMNILEHDFFKLMTEFSGKSKLCHIKLSGILKCLLVDIIRMHDVISSGSKIRSTDKIAGDVINYINENYTEHINSTAMSRVFSYNPNYLNSVVKQKTGYSICRYVIICRLSKALYLLDTSDMAVSEISDAVGFNELSHFSRYFKKFMGYSPIKYRELRNNILQNK